MKKHRPLQTQNITQAFYLWHFYCKLSLPRAAQTNKRWMLFSIPNEAKLQYINESIPAQRRKEKSSMRVWENVTVTGLSFCDA